MLGQFRQECKSYDEMVEVMAELPENCRINMFEQKKYLDNLHARSEIVL